MCQLLTHETDRCILLQVDGICDKNVVFPFLIQDTHGAFEAFAWYQGVGVSNPKVTPLFLAAGHGLQEALVQYYAKVVGIFSP